MERLVDSYIRAGPLKSFPFMEPQYAYQKQFALGVFLDIDGAFENVSFGSMDAAIMGLF
jgi:hypothetical protein